MPARLTFTQGGRPITAGQGLSALAQAYRPPAQRLMDEYQKAYDEARAANEARYADILKGYQGRYGSVMGMFEGMGDQARRDIRRDYTNLMGAGQQDLVSRGLTGTTILPTMRMGYEREMQGALGRHEEQLRRERLGYEAGLSADTLGFMERRTDTYPDYAMMANLAMAYGQGGDGGGGGGGGRRVFGQIDTGGGGGGFADQTPSWGETLQRIGRRPVPATQRYYAPMQPHDRGRRTGRETGAGAPVRFSDYGDSPLWDAWNLPVYDIARRRLPPTGQY